MYLIYAPIEKFGNLPPNYPLLSSDVTFTQNIAFTHKQYWQKVHCQYGCKDISPKIFFNLRKKRVLKNILVWALGGIGDSMWLMPFCKQLRLKYDKAVIAVIVDPKAQAVWRGVPYVNVVVEQDFVKAANFMHKADEVFDFSGTATALKNFQHLDPIEAAFKMAGWPLPKLKKDCRPHLVLTADEGKASEKMLKENGIDPDTDKIIVMATNTSTPNRDWPVFYYIELTKLAHASGFKVVWIGDKVEMRPETENQEIKNLGHLNLVGLTPFRQAMSIIGLCDVVVAPNSSLMVVSTAFGVPTVALFGAFNPKIRAKFYERCISLMGKAPCAPCGEHWTECREGHPSPCMKSILPTEVMTGINALIKKYPRNTLEKKPID